MMLEHSTRDFKSLIERLNVLKAYEASAKDGDRYEFVSYPKYTINKEITQLET